MSTERKKLYFDNLDGLRFFSFLSVFFYHSFYTENLAIRNSATYDFIKRDVFGNGNLGVNFFFVLSGFLITFLLIEEKLQTGKIQIGKFYVRRILRIWPLYFLCVVFGFYGFPAIKSLFGDTPNETASILSFLTFTSNFDMIRNGLPDASILGVLWSIAIEEQFYFVWPIILFLLPVNKQWIAFSFIIAASLVFRALNDEYMMHEVHTLSCISDMAVGGLGAWLIAMRPSFKLNMRTLKRRYFLILYALFVAIFFFRDEVLYSNYYIRIFERLLISLIFVLIILEQNYSIRSLFKLSKAKTITKLGIVTYGLYCLHFVGILFTVKLSGILSLNEKPWQVFILQTVIALLSTIVIAKISYMVFEKPFLKMKDKFAYFVRKT